MKPNEKSCFWFNVFFFKFKSSFFSSIFSTLFFCKVAESATFGMHRCSIINIWIGCCVLCTSVCAIEHAKASFLLLVACLIRVKGQYTNTAISRCDLPERHDVHGFVFSRCCCRLVIHSEIHKVNWRVKLRLKDVKEETIKTNSTNTQIIECSQRAEKNGPRALFPPIFFCSLEWRYDAIKVDSFAVILFRRVWIITGDINSRFRGLVVWMFAFQLTKWIPLQNALYQSKSVSDTRLMEFATLSAWFFL